MKSETMKLRVNQRVEILIGDRWCPGFVRSIATNGTVKVTLDRSFVGHTSRVVAADVASRIRVREV